MDFIWVAAIFWFGRLYFKYTNREKVDRGSSIHSDKWKTNDKQYIDGEGKEKFSKTLEQLKEEQINVEKEKQNKTGLRVLSKSFDRNYPYFVKRTFFDTPSERKLYEQIKKVLNEDYEIYPHIKLDMIFNTEEFLVGQEREAYFSKINKKSIDYLVVDINKSPRLGIEVDGPSHTDPSRFANDAFKDRLFKVCGIPLVRFDISSYADNEVKNKIQKSLNYVRGQ